MWSRVASGPGTRSGSTGRCRGSDPRDGRGQRVAAVVGRVQDAADDATVEWRPGRGRVGGLHGPCRITGTTRQSLTLMKTIMIECHIVAWPHTDDSDGNDGDQQGHLTTIIMTDYPLLARFECTDAHEVLCLAGAVLPPRSRCRLRCPPRLPPPPLPPPPPPPPPPLHAPCPMLHVTFKDGAPCHASASSTSRFMRGPHTPRSKSRRRYTHVRRYGPLLGPTVMASC